MGKVTITVTFHDGMKMPKNTMVKNIEYVLAEHFKSMDSYTKVSPPRVTEIEVNDEQ